MISLNEALNLIKNHQQQPSVKKIKTKDSLHRVLASDIVAPLDLPPFTNSTVDGFAINTTRILPNERYVPFETFWANAQLPINATAPIAKIMTGAPLPKNLDAVVMKEKVSLVDEAVIIHDIPRRGTNVRYAGEDIHQGELVASASSKISPQKIGMLLGLGIDEVLVYNNPTLKIICTGDELVCAPQRLQFGQVYFLVGEMLRAQCATLGFNGVTIELVRDCENDLEKAINDSAGCDLILLTGGMSKGERDLVRPSLKKCGVQEIFYQGYWRPGMPLWFGQKKDCTVFGLPGNPVAVFVCFHVFVRTFLLGGMGLEDELKMRRGILKNSFEKAPQFSFFARANVNEFNELTILPGQGSHEIGSLSKANALCYLTPEQVTVKPNDIVYYYPI